MQIRPRRLRGTDAIRRMTRETRVSPDSLILPIFIREGKNIKDPINSLDGHFHYSPDRLAEGIDTALEAGVKSFLLFGLPEHKDELGSAAYLDDGVVQTAIRLLRERYDDQITLITDVCLCEYTSHGHCGALCGAHVDNDATLPLLAKTAVSHILAGADIVAPSDMMDGRVAAIRLGLDAHGCADAPILSYAVKYASSFYGPFRDAAGSAPEFGDRKTYQMDYHNIKEALKEAALDAAEGADMLMVKPALGYGDVIAAVAQSTALPVAAYSVSGEYAMIKSAARAGLIDEYGAMCETAAGVFRAGAGMLITYYANELAVAMKKGDLG